MSDGTAAAFVDALVAAVGRSQVDAVDATSTRVHPGSAAEIAQLVAAARAHHARLTVEPDAADVAPARDSHHPICLVQLDRMTHLLDVDETSLLVHAQAGVRLGALEAQLAARGMTLGALPSASLARTVGAMLAAPRPTESTPRGRLVDACAAVDAVLGTGTLITTRLAPRRATGPDLSQALIGARGATGIITSAWLRARRLPPATQYLGWIFDAPLDDLATPPALAVIHALLDRGGRPADVALADDDAARPILDAAVSPDDCLLALRLDGVPEMVAAEVALARALVAAHRARPVDAGLVERWLADAATPPRQRLIAAASLADAWRARRPGSSLRAFRASGAAALCDDGLPPPRARVVEGWQRALAAQLDPAHLFGREDDAPAVEKS